jgi:hypothetical protein
MILQHLYGPPGSIEAARSRKSVADGCKVDRRVLSARRLLDGASYSIANACVPNLVEARALSGRGRDGQILSRVPELRDLNDGRIEMSHGRGEVLTEMPSSEPVDHAHFVISNSISVVLGTMEECVIDQVAMYWT